MTTATLVVERQGDGPWVTDPLHSTGTPRHPEPPSRRFTYPWLPRNLGASGPVSPGPARLPRSEHSALDGDSAGDRVSYTHPHFQFKAIIQEPLPLEDRKWKVSQEERIDGGARRTVRKSFFLSLTSFPAYSELSSGSHGLKAGPAAPGVCRGSELARMTPLEGCRRGAPEDFDPLFLITPSGERD